MKFLASVCAEMKKVTWPTLSQNRRDTTIVLLTSLFFAIFLGSFDWLFEQAITFLSN